MVDWKPVCDFLGYEVSSDGRVKRTAGGRGSRPGKVLKNSRDANGYAVVNLYRPNNGGAVKCYVHRLVAQAFLEPQPSANHHVAHWDGDGMNANVDNLRWALQSDNEADKRRHGRANYTAIGSRVLSPQDLEVVWRLHQHGASLREIGRRFGRSHNTIATAMRNGTFTPR